VPYAAMTVPPLFIALYGFVILLNGAFRFWRETRGGLSDVIDLHVLWRATQDAFGLTYMKGGGVGCNYPKATFSQSRRWFHHLVFYGFLFDFVSTSVAAFYDHFLGWQAPYPLLSWPVVLGTSGGVGLLIGTSGRLYLKWQSDRDLTAERMSNMDVALPRIVDPRKMTGILLRALTMTASIGTV